MQEKLRIDDTIAAIATPPGIGAVSIIRISGDAAVNIADGVFRGHDKLTHARPNTIHFGRIISHGEVADQVLASVFRAPHSYTGEDVVEISCHGGEVTPARILDLVLSAGARRADPGEFTRRAFVNGKLDLSQAEAVAELIAARGARFQQLSVGHLQGNLGERVRAIRESLLDTCSLLEIDLDFSEEGIEVIPTEKVMERLARESLRVEELIRSYEVGKVLRDGVRVAIVGPPNAGKSSLFNALLASNRSIVSPRPGTTRDYIEESVSFSGILFSLVDTAGNREAEDEVESEGVRRSGEIEAGCDISLAVVDLTDVDGGSFWQRWLEGKDPSRVVVALNKVDLVPVAGKPSSFSRTGWRAVPVSALTGEGMEELRVELLGAGIGAGEIGDLGVVVTTKRVHDVLRRTRDALGRARASAENGAPNEFVALDTREAIAAISEVTGEVTSEEILNNIFGQFCVGK